MNNDRILMAIGFVGVLLSIMAMAYGIMTQNQEIRQEISDLSYNYDKMMSEYEKSQFYNETKRKIARTVGLYSDNDLIMMWVKDRKENQILKTFAHELAHHNITLDRLKKRNLLRTQLFIDTDYGHFCEGKKQVNYLELV